MVINKIGNQLEEQALVAITSTNRDLKQNTNGAEEPSTKCHQSVNAGDVLLDESTELLSEEKRRDSESFIQGGRKQMLRRRRRPRPGCGHASISQPCVYYAALMRKDSTFYFLNVLLIHRL